MLPIGPLMTEHRLIESFVEAMKKELAHIEQTSSVDASRIETLCDCMHTYADLCHHGKEENILFRALDQMELTGEHRQTMEELIEEHRQARRTLTVLREANAHDPQSNKKAMADIITSLKDLISFYPQHIEKEDDHFFLPTMDYFNTKERESLIAKEQEFDKQFIHTIYRGKMDRLHQQYHSLQV